MPTDPSETSIILGSGEQLDLIGPEQLDAAGLPPSAYADAEARGRFTGERLFSTNPKLYHAIAKLLARGETYREIAEICQVSTQTVTGVAYRERVPIETLRERIARVGLDVSRLSLEAMLEILSDPVQRAKVSIKDLAVVHGIATSNSQLLGGGATARVEVSDTSRPGHDDYDRLLAEARAEAARRREINVTATGLSAGKPVANEGAPAALTAPAATVDLEPSAVRIADASSAETPIK